MRLVHEGKLDGHINMARDIELLRLAEEGVAGARVYEWDGAWVSLGNSQNAERDLLNCNAISWVMRPTGGKAVLHGHDLTVSIAVPLDNGGRSVKAVYRRVIAPLIQAINDAGLHAALGEDTSFVTRGLKTADCFRHISPNDVVDPTTGRKLIGCALRITKSAALAQCSIPLAMPLVDPAQVYVHAHVPMPLAVNKEELAKMLIARIEEYGAVPAGH